MWKKSTLFIFFKGSLSVMILPNGKSDNFMMVIFQNMFFSIDTSIFHDDCGTREILVELWRVISTPKIDRPDSFGSVEYFHRDQHCENPNPDLLTKHGVALKTGSGSANEVVVFHHVVEREYMVKMCPCVMSHCTSCENVSPRSHVCSKIIQVRINFIFLE